MNRINFLIACSYILICGALRAEEPPHADTSRDAHLQLIDVFQLEFAADPQISPDGTRVVYARNFFDIMKDARRSNLWTIGSDGSEHRPLTTGNRMDGSPRWSPDSKRLAYVSNFDGTAQLYCRWMDSGETAKITNLTISPSHLTWSPDGRWIAFSMLVPERVEPFAKMPPKPEGAEWAEPANVIRRLVYRHDGQGYLKQGYNHVFVVPSEGGTPRQLTNGDFDHEGPLSWSPDSAAILFSSNRNAEWEYDPVNSEVYEVLVPDGSIKALTDRKGPDANPAVSPDGRRVAYVGFDDHQQGYQVSKLYVMNRDGSDPHCITNEHDRDINSPVWKRDGSGLYFQYDEQGNTKVGFVQLDGTRKVVAENLGGATVGRPYASGSYSVSNDGAVAYSYGIPERPADVAIGAIGKSPVTITSLNADFLSLKKLGSVETFWFDSSADGRRIQAWIVKPPDFDATKKYPLLLEIHGGPFANYGHRFSAEMQLYAAAGYVVLYCNPRGSTSYGEEFGNLIHHKYPGQDYDDLMTGVDVVIKNGYIDTENLFVTGGSGGGVLTAWIVGKTNRFRAAVAAKPVINWYSFALTADMYPFFYRYWFPGFPWEHASHYLERSPLSLVGNVSTPTMLLTGEQDHRTPISESEQFYQALKLRKIDTALVRIPGASHDISARPSNLISQVVHTLEWFEQHKKKTH